jgi:HD-GYP domain-containing protein (c-di-GMP phosphodiesterase class II)
MKPPLIGTRTRWDRLRWMATLGTTLLVASWEIVRAVLVVPGSWVNSAVTVGLAFLLANFASVSMAGLIGRLEAHIESQNRELATLNAVIKGISESPTLDAALKCILNEALKATASEVGLVWLRGQEAAVVSSGLTERFVQDLIDGGSLKKLYQLGPESGEPVFIPASDPRHLLFSGRRGGGWGPRWLAVVPIASKGMILGMLGVGSFRAADFSSGDLSLLRVIGEEAGVAVENAWVYETGRKQLERMAALTRAATAISAELDLSRVLQVIVQETAAVLSAPAASVMLWDDKAQGFVIKASTGFSSEYVDAEIISAEVAHAALKDAQALNVFGLRQVPAGWLDSIEREAFPSVLRLALERSGDLKGFLNVYKKEKTQEFLSEEVQLAASFAAQAAVAIDNATVYKALEHAPLETITALVAAIEAKDPYTKGHCHRVAQGALAIGKKMGLLPQQLEDLRWVAMLHDIGMIGVPHAILHKSENLTEEEWQIIKTHPLISAEIVAKVEPLKHLVPAIRSHHECYDGGGYPDGIAGEEIPLAARIVAVFDALDAMTNPRPYRPAMPITEAQRILRQGSGSQWDPKAVEACLAIHGRGVRSEGRARTAQDHRRSSWMPRER